MKNAAFLASRIAILVILAAIMICPQAGCENKRERGAREVIGFPQSFADLAEAVKPAVVNVSTVSTTKVPGNPFQFFFGPKEQGPFEDFLKRFFGDMPDRELKQKSLGSGVVIDRDGFILTNYHVVQRADEITVRMADGRELKARVVGRDPKTDLALIKISSPTQSLPALPLGDSDAIRVGDWVLAVGNPFGLAHTVTQGIISATGRVIGAGPYDNFLQTDAPINPGNSGGPLINIKGEVVGICTAIVASGQGIGFAIPSNMAKNIVAQLREKGKVTRGWIGVSVQPVTPEIAHSFGLKEAKGVLVGDVVANSPAEAAGIKRGDIILAFNGKELKNISDLPLIVAQTPVGKTIQLRLLREGKEIGTQLKVAEMPEEKTAVSEGPGAPSSKTRFGLAVDNISPAIKKKLNLKDSSGVMVMSIQSGSPADDAGIQPGDVIREINRTPIRSLSDYRAVMTKIPNGGSVLLLLSRGGATFYASIRGE
jgi:serine protease Do